MNKIQKARKAFADAFDEDPEFRDVYVANIAMFLYDNLHWKGYKPKLKPEDRNEIANGLIDFIFYDKNPYTNE